MMNVRMMAAWVVGVCALAGAGAGPAAGEGFLKNGVTGHRGGVGFEKPENTMTAFKGGIAAGADWIELDIHLTKDGEVVVCHDVRTGRTGDLDLAIKDSTWEELKKVDVAAKFREAHHLTLEQCPVERLPLLRDVVAMVRGQGKTRVSIQPKDESVDAAIKIVRELDALKWVGFNDSSLKKMSRVKELEKGVPVFWDRPAKVDVKKDIPIAKEKGFETMVLHQDAVTEEAIKAIHAAGMEAGAWTVDDEEKMKQFLAWGIDRIYTDKAGVLLKMKGEGAGKAGRS